MYEFNKAVTYLVSAFIICFLAEKIQSDFINGFTENFIAMLTTLLAINIASGSLIAGKLAEINTKTGQKFEKTRKELKRSLSIQLILIAISFFVLLFKSSGVISEFLGEGCLSLLSNTITIGIFIYYLDTIRDLGKALFSLLNFDDKE